VKVWIVEGFDPRAPGESTAQSVHSSREAAKSAVDDRLWSQVNEYPVDVVGRAFKMGDWVKEERA